MNLFGNSRQDTREVFFQTWQKMNRGEPLEGIENIIARIVQLHPEYHDVLRNRELYEDRDYLPEYGETNPFLHMGMHVAIEEQVSIDQPRGIRAEYERLMLKLGDPHAVQHTIMECLGEMLWQSQKQQSAPDESIYLACLRRFHQS